MIVFPCESCGKPLRVAEDKVGKRAKCPACGQISTVPAAGGEEFRGLEDVEDLTGRQTRVPAGRSGDTSGVLYEDEPAYRMHDLPRHHRRSSMFEGMPVRAILAGVLATLAAAMVLTFFLPWRQLVAPPESSARGRERGEVVLIRATGWQVSMGRAEFAMEMKPLDEGPNSPFTPEQRQAIERLREKAPQELNELVSARPWFLVGLLAPVALLMVLAWGLMGQETWIRLAGMAALLAMLSAATPLLVYTIDMSSDIVAYGIRQIEKSGMPPERQKEAIAHIRSAYERYRQEHHKGDAFERIAPAGWVHLVLGCVAVVVAIFLSSVPAPGLRRA